MSESEITEHPVYAAFTVPIGDTEIHWIGTLNVIWAQVEYLVEAGIYNLNGLTFNEGRATALPRDISEKTRRLATLAGDKCERAERMIFLGLCERIIAAAPRRNLAVHGQWVRQSDHNDEPAAVSWFKVPVDEPIKKLYPAELPPLTVEAGAISKALYELLDHRGAFAAIAE